MGKTLEALRKLQSIEDELAEVRRHLRIASAAVDAQRRRLDQMRQQHQGLHDDFLDRQKRAGAVELDLRGREEETVKLRQALSTARTNKEYAAILTHINTIKADSSKLEDEALRMMQEADKVQAEAQQAEQQIAEAEQVLQRVEQTSAEQIARLEGRLREFQEKRDAAAADVPSQALVTFDRIAATRDGDVMAQIVVVGTRPPHEYVCGGCNMSITAEHANALRTRDELRSCDCCGRILYLAPEDVNS